MAFWYFIRSAPGELQPVPLRTMEAFFRQRARLPGESDGFVRYAGLAVSVSGRTAMGIERLWFARCRLRSDGRLDEEHLIQVAAARRKLLRGEARAERTGALVDASKLFELRGLRNQCDWEPEDSELLALRRLVNHRAGWEML